MTDLHPIGAVISSTDAATVFSILRSRKLGLKNRTAPLLEMESGAVFLLKRISFQNNGFDMLLFIAIALVSYALPDLIGGNGYLSAYIVGIVLGNTEFPERRPLVSFFDAITSLMQIVIFFLLGMLAIPLNLLHSLLPAMIIFVFLTLVARPLAVCGVLAPFNKYPFRQLGLLSFVGLRGAASIVFAINILTSAHGPQSSVSARSLAFLQFIWQGNRHFTGLQGIFARAMVPICVHRASRTPPDSTPGHILSRDDLREGGRTATQGRTGPLSPFPAIHLTRQSPFYGPAGHIRSRDGLLEDHRPATDRQHTAVRARLVTG